MKKRSLFRRYVQPYTQFCAREAYRVFSIVFFFLGARARQNSASLRAGAQFWASLLSEYDLGATALAVRR